MKNLNLMVEETEVAAPHLSTLALDVPDNCDVYVFYIPGIIGYDDLKKVLIDWGEKTGKNIFVGLWDLDAESWREVLNSFRIRNSPAIVVFGNPKNSTDGKAPNRTAYARIDNSKLLSNLIETEKCINETCNLFTRGQIKQAVSNARFDQFNESLFYYLKKIASEATEFLQKLEVKFDLLKGTITLSPASVSSTSAKPSSGSSDSKPT